MNEYLFYTAEGYTTAPNENYEVENCQLLGTAKGKDPNEAKHTLLKECPWILEAGFSQSDAVAVRLKNNKDEAGTGNMLSQWKTRGYIEALPDGRFRRILQKHDK